MVEMLTCPLGIRVVEATALTTYGNHEVQGDQLISAIVGSGPMVT